jgi:outer membrane protein TolC
MFGAYNSPETLACLSSSCCFGAAEAVTNNYDLHIALARVDQARALAMQARSQFIPSVTYNGNVSRGETTCSGPDFPTMAARSI